MSTYNAPKPTYTGFQWAESILSRLFFPPILLWDLLKLGVNKLVGEAVSELVLPAQASFFSKEKRYMCLIIMFYLIKNIKL